MGARLSAAGLQRLHVVASSHVGDALVPGLVALVARGSQVHVEVLGSATIGGPPMTRDAVFRISSTTKPITGAATMALVDDGLIDLDEPVGHWLPELADPRVLRRMDGPLDDTVHAHRAITARDLLTFTFGFGLVMEMFTTSTPWPVVQAADSLRLNTIGPPEPRVPPDPDTWIANLGSLPLLAQPGERWLYNTGAQVLGVLMARAAGQPLIEVMRSRLFEPLGMGDTSFWSADGSRLVTAYRKGPEGLVAWDGPDGDWSRRPAFGDAAAGLVSTVDDLHAFARMLLEHGRSVVSADAVRAMTRDQLTAGQKAHGGLGPGFFQEQSWGFCMAVRTSGAYGWDGGLGTSFLVDPNHDLVVIVLTQRMFDTPVPTQVHRDIQAAAYAALE